MSSQLSGYVATLSGQVASLAQVQSFIDQQILLRPDITAFSQYQTIVNSQLEYISDTLESLQMYSSTLQNLIINTNIELAALTTGVYALSTGLSSTNSGLFALNTGVAYIYFRLTGHIFADIGSVHTGYFP